MMTEDEAEKKWCPYAFAASPYGVKLRKNVDGEESRCISSGCMMWRLTKDFYIEDISNLNSGIYKTDETKGYCGLAGRL